MSQKSFSEAETCELANMVCAECTLCPVGSMILQENKFPDIDPY